MSESTKPDSIFLQVCEDGEEFPVNEATWCQDRINDSDVEYVRVDIVNAKVAEIEDLKQQLAAKDAEIAELKTATCNCRWENGVYVKQCELHKGWVDCLHEQAEYRRERDLYKSQLDDSIAQNLNLNRVLAEIQRNQETTNGRAA